MPDKAMKFTDEKVKTMERHLNAVYAKAEKSMRENLLAFSKTISAKADKLLKAVNEAKDPKEKLIAKNAYIQFYLGVMKGKEYKKLSASLAADMYSVNQEVAKYINGHTAAIYAENFNYLSKDMGRNISAYTPVYASVEDAEKYGNITQQDTAEKKDEKWNEKNLKSAVLAGAILLLAADKVFSNSSKKVAAKNHDLANQHAQGMASDAETKGRLDAMYHAKDTGNDVKKRWIATKDNKTRDRHRHRDGKTIPLDDEFAQGLSRPRDPRAKPEERCNCRCSLGYDVGQKRSDTMAARKGAVTGSYKKASSFKATETEKVQKMTYEEWAKWRGL